MKSAAFGIIAAAALLFVPAAAQAQYGHGHGHSGYHGGWNSRYGGGWGGNGWNHHHHHSYYRSPWMMGRPCGVPFYGPRSSFFYSNPNTTFGFGY